jgi:hypothetical protein
MPFETDKNNGFKFDASELLKTGVYPEVFDRRIPFWKTVDGVQYTEFGMRRKAGREEKHDFITEGSNTDVRGIIATKEFNDKVAYIGDRNNIYSYRLSPTATTAAVDKVGTGYTLVEDSTSTNWDTSVNFDDIQISSATISGGLCEVTTSTAHGLVAGSLINVVGLTDSTGANVGGDNILAVNDLGIVMSSNKFKFATTSTGTVTIAGSPPSASAYVEFTETQWLDLVSVSAGPIGFTYFQKTTWDEGANEPDQWDFETYGSFVVGAKGSTKPVIKKNNVNFNLFHNDQVSGATVHVAGTNNQVDDQLTQASVTPSGGSGLTVTVTEVSGGGITAFEITNFGSGYANNDVITLTNAHTGTPSQIKLQVPNIDYDSVQAFHKQGPHLLAFNYSKGTTNYDTSFSWCSADDLDDWVGSATNTAGELLIREANTPIVCVSQLGNSLAVYTENQMFLVSYVGLPNIFGYKVALESGVGAVSPNSVVPVGRKNYGLCKDGFFVTDGASVQLIGRQSGINKYFKENANFNATAKVYAFDNSAENEVVWGVPINSSNISQEMYYNYKTNQWGMRTSTVTAYLSRGVFNEALSGDSTGKFYYEGTVPTLANPATIAETKAHDLNNADRIKEVTALRVGKEGSGSPTVSVGFTETIDATPTYLDKDKFTVDDTFKSFHVRTAGRYIHLKVESSGTNDDWELTDMVIQGRFEGER